MIKTALEVGLQELHTQVIHLGSLADEALIQALEALKREDQEKAGAVIREDEMIDEEHLSIEQRSFDLLMTQQPLGSHNLRYLTSLSCIASDLERIGDEAEDIAQMVVHIVEYFSEPIAASPSAEGNPSDEAVRRELLDFGQHVHSMIERTMQAFADVDAQAAQNIWLENTGMHARCYTARSNISTGLEIAHIIPALLWDKHILQRIICLLAVVHALERIGDHCSNICERIVYIVRNDIDLQPLLAEL